MFYRMYGGYAQAQRKIACFSNLEDDFQFDITILISHVDLRFRNLSHKDVLGALMNLGIEREMLGDLVVEKNRIIIFAKKNMENYIVQNLTRIASCPVSFCAVDEIVVDKKMTEQILINVSSLRMDAIISSLAHVSRKEASAMLHKGYVKLNDIVLEQNRQLCNNDFVSIRRCGRFQYIDIKSTTKKGRLVLRFEKFI